MSVSICLSGYCFDFAKSDFSFEINISINFVDSDSNLGSMFFVKFKKQSVYLT